MKLVKDDTGCYLVDGRGTASEHEMEAASRQTFWEMVQAQASRESWRIDCAADRRVTLVIMRP